MSWCSGSIQGYDLQILDPANASEPIPYDDSILWVRAHCNSVTPHSVLYCDVSHVTCLPYEDIESPHNRAWTPRTRSLTRHQCLENDRVHEFSAEITFGQVDTRLVARLEPRPCPWFVGITQVDMYQFYQRGVRRSKLCVISAGPHRLRVPTIETYE